MLDAERGHAGLKIRTTRTTADCSGPVSRRTKFNTIIVLAQDSDNHSTVSSVGVRGKRSHTMTPEDRDQMIELCKRIARETDPKKLAAWIEELNEIIQSKIRELRDARRAS
jgi:hypothetical protein